MTLSCTGSWFDGGVEESRESLFETREMPRQPEVTQEEGVLGT